MKKIVCIMALLCAFTVQANAQKWKDVLSGVVQTVVGDKATTETSLIGTWSYVGPDCQLKGDDILKNVGGEAAGGRIRRISLRNAGFGRRCCRQFPHPQNGGRGCRKVRCRDLPPALEALRRQRRHDRRSSLLQLQGGHFGRRKPQCSRNLTF